MTALRRVAVTGVGVVSPTGTGWTPLAAALAAGISLGADEPIPTWRGQEPRVRVARLAPFERERHIPARSLRRMGSVSQIWTVASLMARDEAGLGGEGAAAHAPERRGVFMGTGFGCIDSTWDYLLEMVRDGCGTTSPFLFSESVANAPSGHAAIELDARGPCISFTCGDASAMAAVSRAAAAIRQGRIDVAYAGGVDLMVPPLLRVLAILGLRFVGEGAVCLVLEDAAIARRRGAPVLAEIAGTGMTSDPTVGPVQWSRDTSCHLRSMRAALRAHDDERPARVARACLQGAPDTAAAVAEHDAAVLACPGATLTRVSDVLGHFGASGGFSLAAAAMAACAGTGDQLVSGPSWGGAITCVRMAASK
ncbi:MAG: beta-ketoacyl synthase N-terminal-like domain-containing protein [Candidatus Polarisedimenticolia bacterium]